MKLFNGAFIFFLMSFSVASSAHSKTLRADCEDLKGVRVDYSKEKFQVNDDGIKNSKPQLSYDFESKKGYYLSTDATKVSDTVELINVSNDSSKISFVGIINGAPILLSIYIKDKILIYSEQATMILPQETWPKSKLFWAKCEIISNGL